MEFNYFDVVTFCKNISIYEFGESKMRILEKLRKVHRGGGRTLTKGREGKTKDG